MESILGADGLAAKWADACDNTVRCSNTPALFSSPLLPYSCLRALPATPALPPLHPQHRTPAGLFPGAADEIEERRCCRQIRAASPYVQKSVILLVAAV